MKKNNLIVTDLDGTLLTSDTIISEKTKKVFQALYDMGHILAIATGRHQLDAIEYAKFLNVPVTVIGSNGAVIIDEKGKKIFKQSLRSDYVNQILEASKSFDIVRSVYQNDSWLIEEGSPTDAFEESVHFKSGFSDFKTLDSNNISKILFKSTPENIDILEEKLLSEFQDLVYITKSAPVCLEIMNINVNKGKAVQTVANLNTIRLAEVVAFGDNLNDFEMLSVVGKGYIMENGNALLKEKLPKVTVIESNNHNGVANQLIKLYGLKISE